MEIISSTRYANLKRCWRRRRYQKLNGATENKQKLKIIRLGGSTRRQGWKLKSTPKLRWKIVSPMKLLSKLHDGYVVVMIWLANNMGNLNKKCLLRGKQVAKCQEISKVSCGEEVDCRLVWEIYKRLAASQELRGF